MARHADQDRTREIARYLQKHPGTRPADIARDLQVSRSTITRTLPALENAGYLVSEDNHGRLWPFRK